MKVRYRISKVKTGEGVDIDYIKPRRSRIMKLFANLIKTPTQETADHDNDIKKS